MATVTYNKKSRSFTVIWKDYAKEALGERYPYGRKSQKWQGDKHPSASERRAVEKELMALAANEEAVFAFLNGKIKLFDIINCVKTMLEKHEPVINPTIDDIFEIDSYVRIKTRELF